MTNGEMIKKVFNCEVCEPIIEDDIIHVIFADKKDSAIGFDWAWWNAEYKDCEHCAKTYGTLGCCDTVSNKWVYSCKEGHEEYARGMRKFGSTTKNDLEVDCISRADARSLVVKIGRKDILGMSGKTFQDLYKGIDALPPVTPQEPFINKPCVSEKQCEHDKNVVLDKIRADIIKFESDCRLSDEEYPSCKQCTDNVFNTIYAIHDKYKAEIEPQESEGSR